MTIEEHIEKFAAFAKTYWDLVPVPIEQAVFSDYPEISLNSMPNAWSLIMANELLEALAFIKRRSWHWLVDEKRTTYDLGAMLDDEVPNFDTDVDEYIERFVRRQFDTFEEAWPYWQEALQAATTSLKENA